jgi:hypothetical protein
MPSPRVSRLLAAVGGVLVLGAAATPFLGMYSRRDDGPAFAARAREVLAAGQAGDSAALVRLRLGPDAVAWMLTTRRHNPALLVQLRQGLAAGPRARNGGRLAVSFRTDGFPDCSTYPLTIVFLGSRASDPIEALIPACAR